MDKVNVGTVGHTSHRHRGLLAMALGALAGSLSGLQSIAHAPAPRRHGRSAIRSYSGWGSKSGTPSYRGQTEVQKARALQQAQDKRRVRAGKAAEYAARAALGYYFTR